jgi:threonine dehydratase
VVAEDSVAEAMVTLMERAKLVVEGAGAVGVAALLTGAWSRHATASR